MSKELFARLAAAAPDVVPIEGQRWIKRESDEDAELLGKADVEFLRLSRQLGASLIKRGENRFVASIGLPDTEFTVDGLEPAQPTPALFQLAILDLDVTPSASESEIREILQGQSDNDPEYEGHDLTQIEPLFPNISYFKIIDDDEYFDDIGRILGVLICQSEVSLPLEISDGIRSAYVDIFKNSSSSYPTVLALQGLLAAFWQTQYIEIYRTIEQLFPATMMKAFSDKIGFKGANLTLNRHTAETLGWRPKEEGALEALVRSLPSHTLEEFRQAFGIDSTLDDMPAHVSRALYRLRNSIVHYRGPTELSSISLTDWQKIVESICKFSLHAYATFGRTYFHSEAV